MTSLRVLGWPLKRTAAIKPPSVTVAKSRRAGPSALLAVSRSPPGSATRCPSAREVIWSSDAVCRTQPPRTGIARCDDRSELRDCGGGFHKLPHKIRQLPLQDRAVPVEIPVLRSTGPAASSRSMPAAVRAGLHPVISAALLIWMLRWLGAWRDTRLRCAQSGAELALCR